MWMAAGRNRLPWSLDSLPIMQSWPLFDSDPLSPTSATSEKQVLYVNGVKMLKSLWRGLLRT